MDTDVIKNIEEHRILNRGLDAAFKEAEDEVKEEIDIIKGYLNAIVDGNDTDLNRKHFSLSGKGLKEIVGKMNEFLLQEDVVVNLPMVIRQTMDLARLKVKYETIPYTVLIRTKRRIELMKAGLDAYIREKHSDEKIKEARLMRNRLAGVPIYDGDSGPIFELEIVVGDNDEHMDTLCNEVEEREDVTIVQEKDVSLGGILAEVLVLRHD